VLLCFVVSKHVIYKSHDSWKVIHCNTINIVATSIAVKRTIFVLKAFHIKNTVIDS
jgi:hypothetical protein